MITQQNYCSLITFQLQLVVCKKFHSGVPSSNVCINYWFCASALLESLSLLIVFKYMKNSKMFKINEKLTTA